MYFRMKLITANGKVHEEAKDTFKSFESVVNALSTLKRFYKSMILYDENDNVVWTYGLFV
ncbi:MAG: hypothetical protein IJ207_06385 [Treponema sp.]|uniref:hypothetical protein n=1 Tax=Treponema sp. TaxID=166 RepID=UPI0025EF6311|nr:hypothetical protein [Treponema sp.]MBQ9281811.1 hypothetical protein [Treponema sp.]